jgi:integrase
MMLNDNQIRNAKPKSNVYRLRDTNSVCRGFGVVVAPSGAKSFYLSFTSPEDGKRKQISLGKYPAIKLAEARRIALERRDKVTKGIDLAREKQQEISTRMEQRTLGTFEDLLDLYVADLEEDRKRTSKEVRRIKNKDIPSHLLSRPAHKVSRDDILDVLATIAQRGAKVHSDNVRAYLRAAFELGIHAQSMTRWRRKAPSFDIQHNPVATIKRTLTRKPKGQRALNEAEVQELWTSTLLTPSMHLALKLILATGQRVEEVLHATRDEFDFKKNLWIIPGERRKTRGHTSEPHLVPLTHIHLELVKEIQSTTNHQQLMFPARGGESPRRYDSLTKAVSVFVKNSGMLSFSARDLRRTFKTLAGSMNIPLEMRNRLQGHALVDVGSVYYDRYDYLEQKRAAMERWSSGLTEIISQTPDDE